MERTETKEELDCAVGRDVLCSRVTAALIGTSLRPLGGKEGQDLGLCLVGWDEFVGGFKREKEGDKLMTVWASEAKRRERRMLRVRRGVAMVCSDWSISMSFCVTPSFHSASAALCSSSPMASSAAGREDVEANVYPQSRFSSSSPLRKA